MVKVAVDPACTDSPSEMWRATTTPAMGDRKSALPRPVPVTRTRVRSLSTEALAEATASSACCSSSSEMALCW